MKIMIINKLLLYYYILLSLLLVFVFLINARKQSKMPKNGLRGTYCMTD